jgi:lipoate-protein ligase A
MAVDEALLREVGRRGKLTLRIYRWAPPTLSLGYFQRAADRQRHGPSAGCPLVRRSSGGGAILHDHELTYSYVAPIENRLFRGVDDLYDVFHSTLINTLNELGIHASLCEAADQHPASEQPFLCFQRRTCGDVLAGGEKVVGSAQRRHKTGVLQHGSILLRQSGYAPELPGLAELARRDVDEERLASLWVEQLSRQLDVEFTQEPLSAGESAAAESLATEKFGLADWTLRR